MHFRLIKLSSTVEEDLKIMGVRFVRSDVWASGRRLRSMSGKNYLAPAVTTVEIPLAGRAELLARLCANDPDSWP